MTTPIRSRRQPRRAPTRCSCSSPSPGLELPGPRTIRGRASRRPTFTVFVRAPYTINVGTTTTGSASRPRRAAGRPARGDGGGNLGPRPGMIVHGGRVLSAADEQTTATTDWRETFCGTQTKGGFRLPGSRRDAADSDPRDDPPAGRDRWALGGDRRIRGRASPSTPATPGPVASTSTRRSRTSPRSPAGVGLVHGNNSRDDAGSGRDRHARLLDGTIPPELLLAVVSATDCPVILETPGGPA